MSDLAMGIVVAHGTLAQGLLDAVHNIADVPPEALCAISNQGKSRDELCKAIEEAATQERVVVFTDLVSGSCHLAASLVARHDPRISIVSGVNLAMVLDFVFNRRLDLPDLLCRLTEKGRDAIHDYRPTES